MPRFRILTPAALVLLLFMAACGNGGESRDDDGVLHIVTTTGQVADLALHVGGDRVKVTSLMGPGIDPHLYKASAGDVQRLRNADLILYNGLHLEAKMGEVLERLGATRPVAAVAGNIPDNLLISPNGYEGTHDPHIWFDVNLWIQAMDAVMAALIDLDPDHAAGYRERAVAYRNELINLDAHVHSQVRLVPEEQRVLITAHDAFAYFGRAYGLEVRGLQGISTASEAGAADVQGLARFIAERRIPALFVETSVSPKAIEAVRAAVRARGFEVTVGGEIFSDALGDADTPAGTYVGMVRHNVDTIVGALRVDPSDGGAREH